MLIFIFTMAVIVVVVVLLCSLCGQARYIDSLLYILADSYIPLSLPRQQL